MPQIIIEQRTAEPDRFMPTPSLSQAMERYAQMKRDAAQWGYDDIEDMNGSFPVVCGKYSDSGSDDWPVSQMQMQLFDGPWSTGTMRDFYHEISFNQFHLDGNVYGWYTTTLTQQYVVGNNYGFGPDAHLDEFLVQLLNWTDPSVEFGQYDNDGADGVPNSGDDDGYVDTIFFIHDGPGGEIGASNIWSHSSSLQYLLGSAFYTNDPSASGGFIKINSYIIQPSVNGSGNIIEIGVFCHEFGHALGLPDLYDTDYSSQGLGNWCLMSGGSWNTPSSPAHMISWCRYKLGWIDPVEVQSWYHDQPIEAIETSGDAFRVWTNGVYGNQYFMVENRQRLGFDQHLIGEGICIWHVDESAQQSNENHPKVDMEEADGLDNLRLNQNSGDNGDVFPGAADNRQFDEFSSPNSNNYYGNSTQVAVWNISDEGDVMTANLDAVYSQPMLDFVDFDLDDSSGDNDGRADPGETVELWILVDNYWAAATSLIGFLSSVSPDIAIGDPTGVFGAVASQTIGSNQNSPFIVTVNDNAANGNWAAFAVHMTASGGFEQDLSFEIQIGTAPVLVVDDDAGANYEQYIAGSLENIDAYYEMIDLSSTTLAYTLMSQHQALIWITGNDSYNTLTVTDRDNLEQYLDNGGSLILSGQNINESIGTTTFFTDYLKCAPNTNTLNILNLSGSASNLLTAGMNLLLIGTTGAGNQTSPSSVNPQGIAEPMFTYTNGQVGAVNYYNSATGAHVAYFAFGIEAVSGLGGTTNRDILLSEVLQWAGVTVEVENIGGRLIPQGFNFASVFPNPFNNQTQVKFSLDRNTDLRIALYNLLGREVMELSEGYLASGEHSLTINGNNLASGVYLLSIRGESINYAQKVVLLK